MMRRLLPALTLLAALPVAVEATNPPPPGTGACRRDFNLAQVYPAQQAALAGYPGPGCWTGGDTPEPFSSAVVPGILCLASGPDGRLDLRKFTNPACCGFPSLTSATLTKTIPGSTICPDLYHPTTIVQSGPREIRTWWPLQFTQPGTTFRLSLRGTCGRNRYQEDSVWTVVANTESLTLLLELFHGGAMGKTEVPCIVGEEVFAQLKACFATLGERIALLRQAPRDPNRKAIAQNAISECERIILAFTLFEDSLADVRQFVRLPNSNFSPTVRNPPPGIPGTVGIIDTLESPCACKLLVDLEYIAKANGLTVSGLPN